jgi:hypothetical protein
MCDLLPAPCAPADRLASLVETLSEAQLCELLATLPIPLLKIVERAFVFAGCNCPLPPEIHDDGFQGAFAARCRHTEDRGQWVLPPAALKILLLRLRPADLAEPPPPAFPCLCWDKEAKVGLFMERREERRGLRHPDDFDAERHADDVGRLVSCQDHGSGWGRLELGDVVLDDAEPELAPDWLKEELAQFRAKRAGLRVVQEEECAAP